MAIELTQEEAKILSQMAYMNNLDAFNGKEHPDNNLTLQTMATKLLKDRDEAIQKGETTREFGSWGSFTNKEQYDMLKDIADNKYPDLSNLKIKDYQNHEGGDNFVGYAFSNDKNPKDLICAFRGTMGSKVGDPSNFTGKAWLNNYNLCLNNASLQLAPAKAFVENNKVADGEIFVTGHSQGGGDALYICAAIPGVTGCVFDAPGIAQTLTPNEKDQLTNSSVINVVNQHDPVGASMEHLEQRIFAQHFESNELDVNGNHVHEQFFDYNNPDPAKREMKDTGTEKMVSGAFKGHYLQNIHFDGGNVIQGERSPESYAVEVATRVAYLKDQIDQLTGKASLGGGVKIVQTLEGGASDTQEITQMQKKLEAETREQNAKRVSDAAAKAEQKIIDIASKAYDAGAETAQNAKIAVSKLPDAAAETLQDAKTAITNSDTYKEAVKVAQETKAAITNSDTFKAAQDIGQTIYNKFTPAASPATTEAERSVAWNDRYKNVMDDIAKSSTMEKAQEKINYYQNDGELDQFRSSGLKVDNDINYITDNLKKSDAKAAAEYEAAAWNDRYKNVMDDIAKSSTMEKAQEKINYYQNDGELDQFRSSGLKVDNDIAYIAGNLKASDAKAAAEQEQLAAWNAKYKNMLEDIQNSPTKEAAQDKINFYQNQGALDQYRASNLKVDNDIKYITDHLQAKDKAQSFCNQVIQDVNAYAENNTFISAVKQKVQSL